MQNPDIHTSTGRKDGVIAKINGRKREPTVL